jgi:serine/threonine-protein kinase
VKFLHPEIAQNADVVTRFVREAQAASAIGHRGIIDIYDVGTTPDGSPYLVMEFLDGKPFASYVGDGRKLDPVHAVEVTIQALSALAVAHHRGIIHRDLKPDNLYVVHQEGSPPMVKLLDFGISKMTLAGSPQDRMTRTGTVLGTPYYMAPEQAAGQSDIDHRLDLYAMGVILYEAVTGRVPFDGDNYNQLIVRILTETAPRPRTVEPGLSLELEAVILKAMARSRDDRFQTAEEMLRALTPFLPMAIRARLGLPTDDGEAAAMLAGAAAGVAPMRLTSTPMARSGVAVDDVAPPPSRKGLYVGLAGAAAAVIVALLVWQPWAGGEGGESPDAPRVAKVPATDDAPDAGNADATTIEPASAAVDAAPAPEAEPTVAAVVDAGTAEPARDPNIVSISLKDLPEGATVLWDGAPVPSLPLAVRRSSAAVKIEVQVEGYEPFLQLVTPTQDLEIEPVLRPLLAGRQPRGGDRPPVRPPVATADAGTAAPPTTAPPTTTRPPTGRADAGITEGRRGTQVMTSFDP